MSSADMPPLRSRPGGGQVSLERLWLNLTGSQAEEYQSRGSWHDGTQLRHFPALTIGNLGLVAQPLNLLDLTPEFELTADDVQLQPAVPPDGHWFRLDLKNGRLVLRLSHRDLEALLYHLLGEMLRPYKVKVSAVRVQVQALDRRCLHLAVSLTIQRSLMSASLDLSGKLQVDDRLQARLTGLQVQGRGLQGLVVAACMRSQLEALAEQPVPLTQPWFGYLQLTDVEFEVAGQLRVLARFGPVKATPRHSKGASKVLVPAARRKTLLDLYIIDSGRNRAARQQLDEALAGCADILGPHTVCTLTPEQSQQLLQLDAAKSKSDPILLVLDPAALADKRAGGYGLRYDLGAVAEHEEALVLIWRLVHLLAEGRHLAEIVVQVQQEVKLKVVRNALSLLSSS